MCSTLCEGRSRNVVVVDYDIVRVLGGLGRLVIRIATVTACGFVLFLFSFLFLFLFLF